MTADVAFWPDRVPAQGPARREVAGLALCFTVSSIVLLALIWAGDAPYAEMVRPTREQAEVHSTWVAYVTGRSDAQPGEERAAWRFTTAERAHMQDVRRVFVGAEIAAAVAAVGAAWLLLRARVRGYAARLLRNASLAAVALVVVVAAFAAVAFDAAFLLFHQVFFPQGNFLFSPGSGLIRLYPQEYFYGVTLRIAVSFLTLAATLAALAQLRLRGRRGAA